MRKFLVMLLAMVMLCCSMALPVFATEEEVATPPKLYPDDLLSSEAKFEEYFRDTQGAFEFEEVDGEYVMTVLDTSSVGYFVLAKDAIPYETYTVTMDVAINLATAASWETASGDEACVLIGCTNPIGTGHQVRLMVAYKTLFMKHEQIGVTPGETFTAINDDSQNLLTAPGDDVYVTFRFEVYEDEIMVYFEGDNLEMEVAPVSLTGSDGSTGDKSYVGFRGSRKGWKVKNFQVYEGIYDPATYVPPESNETEEPTQSPEETVTPSASAPADGDAPTTSTAPEDEKDGDSNTLLIVAIIAAAVVIIGCVVVVLLVTKKKKPE